MESRGDGSKVPCLTTGQRLRAKSWGRIPKVLAPACSGYSFVLPRTVDLALYHCSWLAIRQTMQTRHHNPLKKPIIPFRGNTAAPGPPLSHPSPYSRFQPLFFFFFFLFLLSPWHIEVPRLGIKSKLELDPCHSSSNVGSLTHCTGLWIKLEPLQRQVGSLTHCATVGTPAASFYLILITIRGDRDGHYSI